MFAHTLNVQDLIGQVLDVSLFLGMINQRVKEEFQVLIPI